MNLYIYKFLDFFDKVYSLKINDNIKNIKKSDVLLFSSENDLNEKDKNIFYSKIIDLLGDKLKKNKITYERFIFPYLKINPKNIKSIPKTFNRKFFKISLLNYLLKFINIKNFREKHEIRFYIDLIIKSKTKFIIGIGLDKSLIKASKICNVQTIEVLHGYGYWEIPWTSWGWEKNKDYVPDKIIVFDKLSKNTFDKLKKFKTKIVLLQSYWYNFSNKKKDIHNLNNTISWIPKNKKIVLVSLQWGYDKDNETNPYFKNILENGLYPKIFETIIKKYNEFFWIFRLHPAQLKSYKYNHHRKNLDNFIFKNNNVEWNNGSNQPLAQILKKCDFHITMSSMTSYDAAFMGVPSLLLCPTLQKRGYNYKMFSDLKKLKYAELCNFDEKKILFWLKNTNKKTPLNFTKTFYDDTKLIKKIFE